MWGKSLYPFRQEKSELKLPKGELAENHSVPISFPPNPEECLADYTCIHIYIIIVIIIYYLFI